MLEEKLDSDNRKVDIALVLRSDKRRAILRGGKNLKEVRDAIEIMG